MTDHITGLQWQDNIESKTITKNWVNAQTYCSSLSLDGGGWRLPSRKELVGLSDYGRINPSINPIFINIQSDDYWSSTTYAGDSNMAWSIRFDKGYEVFGYKTPNYHVRCVRER